MRHASDRTTMMMRVLVIALSCLTAASCAPRKAPRGPSAEIPDATQLDASLAALEELAATGDELLAGTFEKFGDVVSKVSFHGTPPLEWEWPMPGKRKFPKRGERQRMFAVTTQLVCAPADMAAYFKDYASAMSLFDEVESKKVGKWLDYLNGALALGGSVLSAVGVSKDSKWMQVAGASTVGGSGLLTLGTTVFPHSAEVVQKTLVRVEVNRQFGILVRQYTPSVDELDTRCTTLRDYVKTIDEDSTADDTLDPAMLATIKEAYEHMGSLYDGLGDKARIASYLQCLDNCELAPAPTTPATPP